MTQNRDHIHCQGRGRRGTTLVELLVAVSLMVVITSTLIPLVKSARLTWDTYEDNAETLQNGRVLLDHLSQHLAQAASIEGVSSSGQVPSYIQYTIYGDTTYRYQVNGYGHVVYGEPGSLSDIAGPVSQLQFTCYDGDDLSSPITDVNDIRLIHIELTCTGSGIGQDKTFSTSVFINTDRALTTPNFEGWWCMDDESGQTTADSSGHGRDGTLENMQGNEWTTGVIGGALEFNGNSDYVDLPIGNVIADSTDCTVAAWVKWTGQGDPWQRIFDFGSGNQVYMMLTANDGNGKPHFAITNSGSENDDDVSGPDVLTADWHHVAVTIDHTTTTQTLYIDGEVVGQNTAAQYNPSDLGETTQNWLAKSQYSQNPNLDGILDDVRLYSRALSAKEISGLISNASWVLFKDFEEAKAPKDTTSLNIHTPCDIPNTVTPVAILGSWESGLTHTAPSGQNRLLILTAHAEDQTGHEPKLEGITYGGQAMTKVKDEKKESNGEYAYVVAYILDEAGIAAATSSTFSPSWNETPTSVGYSSVFVENADQYDPIGDTEKNSTDKSPLLLTKSVVSQSGDMAFLAGAAGHTGSYWVIGFHEGIELDISSADGVAGYRSTYGYDVWPNILHTNPYDRQVLIGFVVNVLNPAPITTIEGDLLIAAVVVDGLETITAPSGGNWTLLSQGDGDGEVTFGVWAKLAAASEPGSHTFTWGNKQSAYGWIMRFKGHDPNSPIDVMDSKNLRDDRTPPCPSVSTSVINALILRLGGFDEDDINVDDTGLSDHITITMDESETRGHHADPVSGGAGYRYQLETGNTGDESFVLRKKQEYRTVTLAIAPDTSGSGQ